MDHFSPLPEMLAERFRTWRATVFEAHRDDYVRLADVGQAPRAMIICCCDSRVLVSEMFGGEAGDYFIHRNIAALVPPYEPDGEAHGTSATIEFAVDTLGVSHLVVLGHSACGGVRGCHDLFSGAAPELADPKSFVGSWLRILEPGYAAVRDLPDLGERLAALEKEAVRVSLANLLTFPFVVRAVEAGRLTLHGAWKDLREGELEVLDPRTSEFAPIR
jgi:carbonic anhydrase